MEVTPSLRALVVEVMKQEFPILIKAVITHDEETHRLLGLNCPDARIEKFKEWFR